MYADVYIWFDQWWPEKSLNILMKEGTSKSAHGSEQ